MKPIELKHLKVGENLGRPRIFIESAKLADAGLEVGSRYSTAYDEAEKKITIVVSEEGDRLVCRKQKGGVDVPLIDLHNNRLAMFGEAGRVVVAIFTDRIEISLHHQAAAEIERIERLVSELNSGTVTVAELCAGGGVMAEALHVGLRDGGINPKTAFVVEKEPVYLASLQRNCQAVDADTLLIEGGIQEVDLSVLPKVSILAAGIPCTGASLSGRAKNKLASAEEHPTSGHLFYSALRIIEAVRPSACIIENVPQYANTTSYQVIKACLSEWGYNVDHRVLDRSLGGFEDRERMVMIATTKGLDVRWEDVLPVSAVPATLGELLEDVPPDSERFKTYSYLADKEARDIAAGKGFRQQVVTPEATRIGTVGAGYSKVRSTEARLQHPTNPALTRLLTPTEHARCKGVPERMIEGQCETTAHEILGQSVLYPMLQAVGRALAAGLNRLVGQTVAVLPAAPALTQVSIPEVSVVEEQQMSLFAMAA